MHTIDKHIFDKPSGNVRGIISLSMTFGKKELQIGHTYLMVGKPAEVSIKAPAGRISAEDVKRMGEALVAYAADVAAADA